MKEYRIILHPKVWFVSKSDDELYCHPCTMIISVPDDRDVEEYIDEYLDGILSDDVRLSAEWEFA